MSKTENLELVTISTPDLSTELQGYEEQTLFACYRRAFTDYPLEQQKEILELANKIDVTEHQKVMAYGALPLMASFEHCGRILKSEQGSDADQRVIQDVVNISKEVNEKMEDFNVMLKTPGLFEKFLLNVFYKAKKGKSEKAKKLQATAVSSHQLLVKLNESYKAWLGTLKEAMYQIHDSYTSEEINTGMLEKYIIAGYIASERIEQELLEKEKNYSETRLVKYKQEYESLKGGYENFQRTLLKLEESRIANILSIGQLRLSEKNNQNIQISINDQMKHGMPLFAQQLLAALFDYQNREVMEGHQAVIRLTEEIMKKVSNNIALTAKESEQLKLIGFCSLKTMQESLKTIITAFEEVKKGNQVDIEKTRTDVMETTKLLEQLESHISIIKESKEKEESGTTGATSSTSTPLVDSSALQF